MSAIYFLLYAAIFVGLVMLCLARPRLGALLAVALFGSLAVYAAVQGQITATVYSIVNGTIFVVATRLPHSKARPSDSPRVGD